MEEEDLLRIRLWRKKIYGIIKFYGRRRFTEE